ncbi:MAG: cytochrome C oxidase subunit IV family protein [Phycisphaerae bacterium]
MSNPSDGGGQAQVGHVVPVWLLFAILLILLVLTWATVAATQVQLGSLNVWIAVIIATVKATLVALYFMHLRYDRPFNGIILISSLVFVMLFVGFALMDTGAYKPDVEWKQVVLQRQ